MTSVFDSGRSTWGGEVVGQRICFWEGKRPGSTCEMAAQLYTVVRMDSISRWWLIGS
jgi:hypothetical protein